MSNTNQIKDLKVFIINLPTDKKKRERIKKLFLKNNFCFKFFKAIDGRKKNLGDFKGYSDFKRKIFFGRSLLPKEQGIFESHREILKLIVKKKYSTALVFEDDISLDKNFDLYLQKILNLPYNWDIIRFISDKKVNDAFGRKVIPLGDNFYLKRYPKLYGGAHAYLISLNGAKKILNLTKNFYYPIDLIMGLTWKNNLNSLICNPGLVWQEKKFNIDPPNSIRFIKKNKSIFNIYFLTRFLFKIYESFSKWGFFLFKFIPDYLIFKKINARSF